MRNLNVRMRETCMQKFRPQCGRAVMNTCILSFGLLHANISFENPHLGCTDRYLGKLHWLCRTNKNMSSIKHGAQWALSRHNGHFRQVKTNSRSIKFGTGHPPLGTVGDLEWTWSSACAVGQNPAAVFKTQALNYQFPQINMIHNQNIFL